MRAALSFALTFLSLTEAIAADGWVRLLSPHFELYTDAGEKKGRDAIAHFEQAWSFFEKASPVDRPAVFPVRLILFRGEKSYKPYRLNASAAAYFTPSQSRDYIVMGDSDAEVYKIALHEYMHLMIRHSGLQLPVWLNEGWAEVYSTLRPASALQPSKGAAIGDMLEGRVQLLSKEPWLSFDELTQVTQSSPVYNEADRAGMFYAESWALVHMLYLAPDYKEAFPKFINALQRGESVQDACRTAWGKSSEQVFLDLQGYLKRKALFGAIFAVRLEKLAENPAVTRVPEMDADLMLGDLLLATQRYEQAQQVFQRVAVELASQPAGKRATRADVMRSLGYVAWARGDTSTALQDFTSAMEEGSEDAKMLFHLAMLERGAREPLPKSQAVLEKALTLKPDYKEARLELGLVLLAEADPQKALAHLLAISSIDNDHAARLFNALALAYAQSANLPKARESVQKAQACARTEADRKQSTEILRWISAQPQQ